MWYHIKTGWQTDGQTDTQIYIIHILYEDTDGQRKKKKTEMERYLNIKYFIHLQSGSRLKKSKKVLHLHTQSCLQQCNYSYVLITWLNMLSSYELWIFSHCWTDCNRFSKITDWIHENLCCKILTRFRQVLMIQSRYKTWCKAMKTKTFR